MFGPQLNKIGLGKGGVEMSYVEHRLWLIMACILGTISIFVFIGIMTTHEKENDKAKFLVTISLAVITGVLFMLDIPYKNDMKFQRFALGCVQRDGHYVDDLKQVTGVYNNQIEKDSKLYYKIDRYKYDQIVSMLNNEENLMLKIDFEGLTDTGMNSYLQYSSDLTEQSLFLKNERKIFNDETSKYKDKYGKGNYYRYFYISFETRENFTYKLAEQEKMSSYDYATLKDKYYIPLRRVSSSAKAAYDTEKRNEEVEKEFKKQGIKFP